VGRLHGGLRLLSTTFSDPKERGKAFGVYGAIVGVGGAIGLVLGGIMEVQQPIGCRFRLRSDPLVPGEC